MIKAIVYTSNTGFTKKYAELLGEELGLPVYEFKNSKEKICAKEKIIYMGWIMAGTIKNYKKAKKLYNIKAVIAVGMGAGKQGQNCELIERNSIKEKLFYLQGGYNKAKLKGIYKIMMSTLEKMIKPQLEKIKDKTQEDIEMIEMMEKGKNCVKKENLNEIIKWVKES